MNVAGYVGVGWTGDAGWEFSPGAPFSAAVTSVVPDSPAARAGVREGDQIDLRSLAVADRIFVLDIPLAKRPIVVSLHRGRAW